MRRASAIWAQDLAHHQSIIVDRVHLGNCCGQRLLGAHAEEFAQRIALLHTDSKGAGGHLRGVGRTVGGCVTWASNFSVVYTI